MVIYLFCYVSSTFNLWLFNFILVSLQTQLSSILIALSIHYNILFLIRFQYQKLKSCRMKWEKKTHTFISILRSYSLLSNSIQGNHFDRWLITIKCVLMNSTSFNSSAPLSAGDMFQDPQWVPVTLEVPNPIHTDAPQLTTGLFPINPP